MTTLECPAAHPRTESSAATGGVGRSLAQRTISTSSTQALRMPAAMATATLGSNQYYLSCRVASTAVVRRPDAGEGRTGVRRASSGPEGLRYPNRRASVKPKPVQTVVLEHAGVPFKGAFISAKGIDDGSWRSRDLRPRGRPRQVPRRTRQAADPRPRRHPRLADRRAFRPLP